MLTRAAPKRSSERLLEHLENPRNVGEIEDADIRVEVSNPICGDVLRQQAVSAEGMIHSGSTRCDMWVSPGLARVSAGLGAQDEITAC